MEIKIIEEQPITLLEMKENLEAIEKRDKSLNFRSNKTNEYLKLLVTNKKKDQDDIKKKIAALNILRLKERHIVKLLDLMPEDLDSLKVIISGENMTLTDEDLKKLLESLK